MSRAIDHIVLPVADLDGAAATLGRLGFTVTPRADHPWGTANRLVQFDGVFLEYLAIADPAAFPPASSGAAFDFARFNRDWLDRFGEGASMLVLTSTDAGADRAAFLKAGLHVHDPFSFERTATLPGGDTATVAFSLTFVSDPALPDIGFFTCRHHNPEHFWKPQFQTHANGAADLAGLVVVAENPADHQILFSGFIGERDIRSTGLGIDIAAGRHTVSVMTPVAYRQRYGDTYHRLESDRSTIAAIRLRVADLAAVADRLAAAGFDAQAHHQTVVAPSRQCHGCALIFEQA